MTMSTMLTDDEDLEQSSLVAPEEPKQRDDKKLLLALAALFLLGERRLHGGLRSIVKNESLALLGEFTISKNRGAPSAYAEAERMQAIDSRGRAVGAAVSSAVYGSKQATRVAVQLFFKTNKLDRSTPSAAEVRKAKVKDRMASDAAGRSVQDAFVRTHITAVERASQRAIVEARSAITPKVQTVAVQEHATAFNDAIVILFQNHPDYDLIWQAVLDKRTCGACAQRDGQIYTRDLKPPPLHISCRCMLSPSFKRR